MPSAITISPTRGFREELVRRGGGDAARCFQCATCSGVCELATPDMAFPRPQMLNAQWGLVDRLAADPSIWLCHQCNDCTARCPRDAKPGDAIQAIRSLVIEEVGAPRFLSRLVGRAGATWPILLGVPVLFWALYIYLVNRFAVPEGPLFYGDVVPTLMIDSVFMPAAAFATVAAFIGARRQWTAWGQGASRNGSLIQGLVGVVADILSHKRFGSCGAARPRRTGHLLLLFGFLAAFATTLAFMAAEWVPAMHIEMPAPQTHPFKILGNVSAVLLGLGCLWLLVNRLTNQAAAGASSAFDNFFLVLVVLLVFSGIGAEIARYVLPVPVALAVYVVHLGMVLSLFLTFPFSKFAHALYRTLAMAHERLTAQRRVP